MKKYFNPSTLFFAALAAVLYGCGNAAQTPPPPPPVAVSVYKVATKPVTGLDSYPATVVALNEIELRPQVSGYITHIFVQDGQQVKKGQKLYQIDQTKYVAARNQAAASLASAKAQLARVQKDVDRYERLDQNEAIAKQTLDNAKAELLAAQAQVQAAEAQVAAAETDLGYSQITAPFDGKIGISQVRLGTQVSPGQPLLNTLSSMDPVQVDFVINEKEIPRYYRLVNAPDAPDSLFTLKLSDDSLYPHPGKLATVDRAVGRQTGTVNVRVEFPNDEGMLIPGMTGVLRVINADHGDQLVIPYKAVTEQMGEYFVYVLGEDDTVTQQTLKLGTVFGAEVAVREGLQAGQTIVVDGIQKLRQGSKVQVQ
ncbi:efflux RND transporter periplasmic adaptor subunit [Algoriphagus sp. H41]|uniref:Efflux RND transporter periplasmic adaptor subunit n=1 Tax=Algoriphagus oliviformis TaxID=2811231 RepID=A0ABS3C760_9BACT|nr:efflux RND transporter periplasmic adaptor subunit [Algoriphagus oliviformis]MBN7812411.1 efflux RND transporter periplasmic adaptor subunit [Algoriphagus oliviformis]